MAKLKGLDAKTELHRLYNVPRRIFGIKSKTKGKSPEETAKTYLKKIAGDLKIAPDLSELKFEKVKTSILGSHVLYQQYHKRKQISGAWIRVDIDKKGHVYNIQNDLIPSDVVASSEKSKELKKEATRATEAMSGRTAIQFAERAVAAARGKNCKILASELLYYAHKGVPVLSWKIVVEFRRPRRNVKSKTEPAEWKMYLDARSGQVLAKFNLLKHITAKGKVFDPNPVVTLNDISLNDKSAIPDNAYEEVVLMGITNSGYLDGPYATTRTTKKRVKQKNLQFIFTRKDRAFKEVMVYFHIHRVQEYIQSLGFDNVLNHPIPVNIDGQKDDNSHYSPTNKDLTFGTGGIDDAEDAEIILHEYGHAIQDNQVPGFGETPEGMAMGEGFGDFLAASFFADHKPKNMRPTLGNWDATAYSSDKPPFLRRLDSKKKYPRDLGKDEHDNGEMWSACLWELRSALGRKAADKLVIAHHFLLTRSAIFRDGANALITADGNLNNGRNEKIIRKIFTSRGIL